MDQTAPSARAFDQSLADLCAALERAAEGDLQVSLVPDAVVPALAPLARSLNRVVARRREAVDAQQRSEARYRALVEEGHAVVYLVDLRLGSVHLMMDPEMEAMLGYTREEWQTDLTLLEQRLHPDDRARVVAAKATAIKHGTPLSIEYRLLTRDGATLWVHDHATIERDTGGLPVRMHGVVVNISGRRRAEEALGESERRFERMARRLPHVIFRWGTKGLEYISPACLQVFGRTAGEILRYSNPRDILIHPDDRARVRELAANLFGGPVQFETRAVRPNGDTVWTEQNLLPIFDGNGWLVAVEGVACDISERKRMEAVVRESEELFHTLAKLSPVGIFRTDAFGKCTYVNEHWQTITDVSFQRALGNDWATALHPDDRARVVAEWQRVVRHQTPFLVEYRFQRRDGGVSWVLGQALPETSASGEYRGHVGTVTDITDRKHAEEALRAGEAHYRHIFEHAAVSLWEEDFSALFARLAELRAEGVVDLAHYLDQHPELVRWAMESVKVLDVNQQTIDLFGARSKEELLAGLSDLFVPETMPVFAQEMLAIAAGCTRFRAEAPMRTLDGRHRDVLVSMTFPSDLREQMPTLVSLVDITERKQAEEALYQSESRYRSIFEGASVAIWEADYSAIAARVAELGAAGVQDFRAYCRTHPEIVEWAQTIVVRDVNEESLKLFGATSKDELLRSYRAVYLPETIPAFLEGLIALAEGARTFETEMTVQTLRGERREVLVSIAFPAPGTSFDRLLVCTTDITEWRRVEQALLEAERGKREAARTATDIERRRLARELHDGALQDLSAVKLLLEVERKRERDERLEPALERLTAVITELRAVVDNLQPGDLSRASLQEAIAAHAKWLSRPNGIALMLALDPEVRIAHAGIRDLYRIAQEALANAVRHGAPSHIAVRLSDDAHTTVLEIEDNGAGFDVTAPHHGMGLVNMRERAAALGGDLEITSAAGTGTRVRIIIPAGDADGTRAIAAAAAPEQASAGRGGCAEARTL